MLQVSNPLSVTSPPPTKLDDSLKKTAFYDRDVDIHDPILSTQSMYEAIRLVLESATTFVDIFNLVHSNLVKETIPQTYNYHEMVWWCAKNYLPDKRVVIYVGGKKVIFTTTPLIIVGTLLLADQGELLEMNEMFLSEKYQGMSDDLKNILLSQHETEGSQLPTRPPPYLVAFLASSSKVAVSMMTQVLGKKADAMLDEGLLGFLTSFFPPVEGPFLKFNYAQFLSDAMHQHFLDFKALRTFRY